MRAATASHGNIVARKAFTISLPGEANAAQADYFGLVSGRDHDKFERLGLTAVRSDLVDAPYVGEFPLVLECEVVAVHELGLHTQFIGEIKDVKVGRGSVTRRPHRRGAPPADPVRHGPGRYYAVGPLVGSAYSIGKEHRAPSNGPRNDGPHSFSTRGS